MKNVSKCRTPVWQLIVLTALWTFIGLEYWPYSNMLVPEAMAQQQVQGKIGTAKAAEKPSVPATPAVKVPSETYTVQRGDQLLKKFGKQAKVVCELNKLANCDHIEVGQVLKLPAGITPRETKTVVEVVAKPATKPADAKPATAVLADKPVIAKRVTRTYRPVVVAPKTNDAGEILYRRVGTAPLNGCGKRTIASISEEAWEVLGLSDDDRVYLREHADLIGGPRIHFTVEEGLYQIETNVRLEQVTFCRAGKVVAIGPMRTAWDAKTAVYGERFVLPSGKMLVWMRNCFNWVILPEEKTVFAPPPPPAEPPVAETPPPEPAIVVASEGPAPTPQADAPKGFCNRFDPHLVIGQEHEPRHDGGDQADSNFLAAALYCTWRNEDDDGTHGLGAKLTASSWSGTVNQRAGKYTGHMHLVGPAYEYISDDGWDTEVSLPMVGQLHERFHQDKYESRRDFNLVGLSAGYNNYERRLRGEPLIPETQVFGTLAIPLSRAVYHSWDGQAIADTEELSRFGVYANAGVRVWLYEDEDSVVLPYAQLGYFLETPSSESLSARLGIADTNRICGIGAGIDHDLLRGGDVAAWGWWCDVVKGIRVGRAVHRKHQMVVEAADRGITVEENRRGYIESIRFGDTWKGDKQ
ncbi:MAG: LysM peptidoglycan-binding domain-containing protein [Candidatus Moraniibacteriota bacterium]|nr:MAG: LysM peptidoglycan-binding domain-containing protein [Candidatus Moranbacteria bacterium]